MLVYLLRVVQPVVEDLLPLPPPAPWPPVVADSLVAALFAFVQQDFDMSRRIAIVTKELGNQHNNYVLLVCNLTLLVGWYRFHLTWQFQQQSKKGVVLNTRSSFSCCHVCLASASILPSDDYDVWGVCWDCQGNQGPERLVVRWVRRSNRISSSWQTT
jgi:hypothetical protein